MMNLFQGMSSSEIVSLILAFLLFNFFAMSEALALAAFYVASRPYRAQVRSSALWYFAGALWFMMSIIATVWAAPAEKSFTTDDGKTMFWNVLGNGGSFGLPDRTFKVVLSLVFWAIGVLCLLIGVRQGAVQKRRLREQALFEDDDVPARSGVSVAT